MPLMLMKNLLYACAVTLLVMTACAPVAAPNYATEQAALPLYPGDATPGQIQAAIVRAGATLGWRMRQIGPEAVRATWPTGPSHYTVQIRFGRQHYQILYRRAYRLAVPPVDEIRTLSRQIQLQVACLTQFPCQRKA